MLRRLVADRESFLTDVAAAEQLAFALQSLTGRWIELDRGRMGSSLASLIDAVFAELDDPHAFDRASFARRVAAVEEALAR